MKKTFTLLSLLTVSTLVFGQAAKTKITAPKLTEQKTLIEKTAFVSKKSTAKTGSLNKGTAAPTALVWSDTFSASANWDAANDAGTYTWEVTTTPYSDPIESTTKADGFALYNSDGNNESPTQPIAHLTNSAANVIDLTGHPNVTLEFQQYYVRFQDNVSVEVSGNGGANYTKFPINTAVTANGATANPSTIKLDISAVAGGNSNVKIRFTFEGSGWDWYWMVDDVKIYDQLANDVAIESSYSDQLYKDGGFYTKIPSSQVPLMPINFRAAISNNGSATQTNVKLTTTVVGAIQGSLFSSMSPAISSFTSTAKDTLKAAATYTLPAVNDTYTVGFVVSQNETDGALADNVAAHIIQVTDSVYARDNGIITGVTSPQYYTNGTSGSEIATIYEITAPAIANSISVFLWTSSDAGAECAAQLYKLSPNGDKELLSTSSTYAINTPSVDAGKWVTLALPGSIALDQDSTYLASIVTGGAVDPSTTPPNQIVIGTDDETEQPANGYQSLVFLANANSGAGGWFDNSPENPMIRLNIAFTPTGVKSLAANTSNVLGQNIPNPFSKESSVTYKLATDANSAVFTVTDVMGRVISSEKVAKTAGSHTVKLGSYAAGLYYYSLNVDGKTTTKKMIVE